MRLDRAPTRREDVESVSTRLKDSGNLRKGTWIVFYVFHYLIGDDNIKLRVSEWQAIRRAIDQANSARRRELRHFWPRLELEVAAIGISHIHESAHKVAVTTPEIQDRRPLWKAFRLIRQDSKKLVGQTRLHSYQSPGYSVTFSESASPKGHDFERAITPDGVMGGSKIRMGL
jgi:hypothetical protein